MTQRITHISKYFAINYKIFTKLAIKLYINHTFLQKFLQHNYLTRKINITKYFQINYKIFTK